MSFSYKSLPEGDPRDLGSRVSSREVPRNSLRTSVQCGTQEDSTETELPVLTVFKKPGIPIPQAPRFQPLLCCRWLLVVMLIPGIVYWLCFCMTTQNKFPLDMDKEVIIDVTNCDLVVEESRDRTTTVTLQYWNAFGQLSMENSTSQEGKNVLVIRMKMHLKIPMFRCRLTFLVNSEEPLPAIQGRVLGASHSLVSFTAVPAKKVDLTLGRALVECTVLPERLFLEVGEGSVLMRLDNKQAKTMTSVTTRHATLDVESSEAIAVQLKGLARKTSLLTGDSITDHGELVHLSGQGGMTSTPKIHITYDTAEETPGYFLVGNGSDTSLKTRRGELQQRGKPFLNHKSQTDLRTISMWMESVVNMPVPWVARLHVMGPGLDSGSWQLLSAEAFLTFPLHWFMLLSAGMIHPTSHDANVQMLSLSKQWPPRPSHTTEDIDHVLWDMFEVLEPFVANVTKATIAWVPQGGKPVIFTKNRQSWTATQSNVHEKQSLLFLVALGLNFCASVAGASFLVVVLRRQLKESTTIKRNTVERGSSHNVSCAKSSAKDWKVKALQLEWPDHAILLRWRKQTGSQKASYFWIEAQPQGDGQKVIVERISADKLISQESSVILEFLFLIDGRKGGTDFSAHHELRHNQSYRFQVVSYDKEENQIAKSAWSDEVIVMPRGTLFDTPFLLLRAFFPVPTPSLRYFIEKHCGRYVVTTKARRYHYNGVIPQHIIVLKNIKVEFHRNFRDFPDHEKEFYLAVHVGECKTECRKETDKGHCITYARTKDCFKAPETFRTDVDDDTTQNDCTTPLDTAEVLKVGSIQSAMQKLTITLNSGDTDEDAAEGTLDFEELFDLFDHEIDELEKGNGNAEVEVDLKVESKNDFDEDYLCRVKAEVSFESNIVDCQVLPKNKRLFRQDAPGQMFYQGMERLMTWDKNNSLLQGFEDFDVYAIYNDDKEPLHLVASRIKTNTLGFTFMADLPSKLNADFVVCQLRLKLYTKSDNQHLNCERELESHRFVILRTWTLCDMELMYAAFCKMNGMPMQRVTQESLKELGVSTATVPLKVVPALRAPFAFENLGKGTVIESPGTFYISKCSIELKGGDGTKHEENQPEGNTVGEGDGQTDQPLLPTNQRIEIMENVWCSSTGMKSNVLQYGTGWEKSFLLRHAFYPVDNLLRSLDRLAEVLSIKSAYEMFAGWFSTSKADFCLEMAISPIEGTLPYFCEAALFILQLVTFCSFPIMLTIFAMVHEFLKHSSSNSITMLFRESIDLNAAYIPDLFFSVHISGQDIQCWMKRLPPLSKILLLASAISLATILVLILESNFLRNLLPAGIQKSVHKQLNNLGTLMICSYLWITLGVLLTWALWFLMAVVIYPEQMLSVLACVAGMSVVCFSMYKKANSTQDKIRTQLHKEVPDVLELICHNFLVEHDRTHAVKDKFREKRCKKVEHHFWSEMAIYLENRFKDKKGLFYRQEAKQGPDSDASGTGKRTGQRLDSSLIVERIFNRALIKEDHWETIAKAEQAIDQAMDPAARERAEQELGAVETTPKVLKEIALQHDDQLQYSHYETRKKLLNLEDEAGGEQVHTFSEELREKLMDVYVRVLDNAQMDADVDTLFEAPEAPMTLALAMAGAHISKLRTFEHDKDQQGSVLQILIRGINRYNIQGVNRNLAEHLDEALDAKRISEHVTQTLENKLPREIEKQLKFVTNEQYIESAKYKLFKELRLLQQKAREKKELQDRFTLQKNADLVGLMQTLQEIGLLDASMASKEEYRKQVHQRVTMLLRSWQVREQEKKMVDSSKAEEFLREMVQGQIWWGALRDLLNRIGFPMKPKLAEESGYLIEDEVMGKFEKFTSRPGRNGLLPESHLPAFLKFVTNGEATDGSYGMMWKAQMIMLLKEVGVCGTVGQKVPEENDKDKERKTVLQTVLQEYAGYEWPLWLEKAWQDSTESESRTGTFMRKSGIQQFINRVAFIEDEDQVKKTESGRTSTDKKDGLEKIGHEYKHWLASRNPIKLWVQRGKQLSQVRGIWYECFAAVLDKMKNGFATKQDGLRCFQDAVKMENGIAVESQGDKDNKRLLLDLHYFINNWLWHFLVEDDFCTLPVFTAALQKAGLTLPPQVVKTIYFAAEKVHGKRGRKVSSLEDRVVMYLATGLPEETSHALIFDHLDVHSLQDKGKLEVTRCFRNVDEKTGVCGFIHPREAIEMLKLMAFNGMSLQVLEDCFKKLRCQFPEGSVKAAFAILDTDGDDTIDLSEFLCIIDYLITNVIPNEVVKRLGMTPQQIIVELILTFATLCMVFLFIFISLGAFQVKVTDSASGQASTLIRAGVGVTAALGLRFERVGNDDTKLAERVRENFHAMLGVTSTQVDSWLRVDHLKTSQETMKKMDPKSRRSTTKGEDDAEKGEEDKAEDGLHRNRSQEYTEKQ